MVGADIFGMRNKPQTVDVWPENHDAYFAFCACSTQWRTGMAGATGLDYIAVLAVIDRMFRERSDGERDAVFADVRVIELAALEKMSEK